MPSQSLLGGCPRTASRAQDEAAMSAVSQCRLPPGGSLAERWDCLQDLTFRWPRLEREYMAIQAARARSCSILQRLLASYLTALFCGKEFFTMYRHQATPRCGHPPIQT